MNELDIRRAEETLLNNPKQFLALYEKMKDEEKVNSLTEIQMSEQTRK